MIRKSYGVEEDVTTIEIGMLTWFTHVERMNKISDETNLKASVTCPLKFKANLTRPKCGRHQERPEKRSLN